MLQITEISITKQANSVIEKETRVVVIRGSGWGKEESEEGTHKVQASSYKMNKYYERTAW